MGGSVALPTAWDRLPRCLCLPALGAVCREPDEGGRGGVGAPGSNTGNLTRDLGTEVWKLCICVTSSRECGSEWSCAGLEVVEPHVVMGQGADAGTFQNTFPFHSQTLTQEG